MARPATPGNTAKRLSTAWEIIRLALIRFSFFLHAVVLLALAIRPSWWPAMLAVIVVDHVALVVLGLMPRSRALGPNTARIRNGDTVYLTFDDGPDPEVTPRVLELLDQNKARATFFIIGKHARAHPELVREIARRGHRFGNHTESHSLLFWFFLPPRLRKEIQPVQELLDSLVGERPTWFRAPAGVRSPWLQRSLVRQDLFLVSWTRRGFDASLRNAARAFDRLTSGLRGGDILLLHDGNAARSASSPVVLEVLPRLLKTLAERGLRSEPLPDSPPLAVDRI